MVQIIQENRKPSFTERLNAGVGRGLEMGSQLMQQHQQQQKQKQAAEQIKQLTGMDISSLSPEMQKIAFQQALQGQNELQKLQSQQKGKAQELAGKNQEKLVPLQSALERVNAMRQLRQKGNLGRGSGIKGFFGGETAKDRGEYETLGNSLIQYATNIPIRNRVEFEKLAGRISDPSITDKEAEGILDAMQQIIGNSLSEIQGVEDMPPKESVPSSIGAPRKSSGQRKPLTAFMGK